jgi:multiple sugar transport system permease protein
MAAATDTAIALRQREPRLSARVREALWGYGFVTIPMAVFGLFFIWPFIYAVYISFYNWGILGKAPGTSATVHNYDYLLHDRIFHIALRNTLEYTVAVVPLEMALGLMLALIVNAGLRGKAFFRASFYFPSIASSVAITTIALYIFNSDGLFNHIIGSNKPWFTSEDTALWSIVGLNAWTTSGTVMLFYLAALQSIPTDVYEAAAIDNTSRWRTFWRITFPLLKPAHFFVLVIFGVGALKIFDQAFIVSKGAGGPNYATMTGVLYIYNQAFGGNAALGVAAAAGVVLFVIIFGLTVVQWFTVGRRDVT